MHVYNILQETGKHRKANKEMEGQSGGAERGQNGREKEEREGGIIEKAFPVAQASTRQWPLCAENVYPEPTLIVCSLLLYKVNVGTLVV